jgi:hypothetical protein
MSQLLRAVGARAAEMVAGRRRQHRRKAPEPTSRINVPKQFDAEWAQKRTRKKLCSKRGSGASAKLPEKADAAIWQLAKDQI